MQICPYCEKEHNEAKGRKVCGTCRVRRSRKNTKAKAIEYLGGKCVRCGYNKCSRALQFHHEDPSQKDFQISRASNPAWEKLKEELNKCMLVCSNCHAEIHEEIENDKLLPLKLI